MKQIRLETGVCHFRVPAAQSLRQFLEQADLSELRESLQGDASDWLYTGAVYVDGQRVREDIPLPENAIVRLHTRRKRYVTEPLRDRIVFQNKDFVVLDKPAGMPTHATLDNFVENAKFLLERELGVPLFTTHRLDIPTEGLLVLAKTPPAQKLINRLFAQGWVEKIYFATTGRDVGVGEYTHYIEPTVLAPRPISITKTEGWWECRLIVEEVLPGHRHRVRLLTGKTHQIRAQFAALGAPLNGDSLYGGSSDTEKLGLECAQLSFRFQAEAFCFTRPSPPNGGGPGPANRP
jgi:23S rRNA-/tRNA-specific pseudouridylate synthase